MNTTSNGGGILTPAEVAALFKVDIKRVSAWADQGKLTAFRTLGGHRRFYEDEVRALLASTRTERQS